MYVLHFRLLFTLCNDSDRLNNRIHRLIVVSPAMEDAHAVELSLDDNSDPNTFFAVYDGHGGT